MNLWHNNWEKFVLEVAGCCSEDMNANELAEKFIGHKVTWSGKIRNVELGQESANGIAMDMPEVKIRLVDNRLIVANYIFLAIKPSEQNFWKEYSPGQSVTFNADMCKPRSATPEVEVSVCSNNPQAILMLGTENAQPVLYD